MGLLGQTVGGLSRCEGNLFNHTIFLSSLLFLVWIVIGLDLFRSLSLPFFFIFFMFKRFSYSHIIGPIEMD